VLREVASVNLSSAESAVRALLVSNDPPTIEQLSESLQELAASTQVCTDIPSAIRLLNTRKFETVVVDLRLGEQTRVVLEQVRLSPSNRTTVAFAITDSPNEAAIAFEAGSTFVLQRPLSAISIGRMLKAAYGLIVRERLRYFRCPVSVPAVIQKHDTGEIHCQAVNISAGGMAIITSVPLKPGTRVSVQFTIPGQPTEFTAQSEVCSYDEKGRVGLRFLEPSPQQRSELREWLSRRLEESLPESVAVKFRTTT
jgi:CheY-like chemotaxis protein